MPTSYAVYVYTRIASSTTDLQYIIDLMNLTDLY